MKQYDVITLPEAELNMEETYSYINEDSPQNAYNWYQGINEAILSLEKMPFRCPIAPENNHFEEEIRHLIVGNYRIIYTAGSDAVFVFRVKRCSQRWMQSKNVADD